MKTPDWILKGYNSKAEWEKAKGLDSKKGKKGKTFKVRRCPKCNSDNVKVVVQKETKGDWECKDCKWTGKKPKIEELDEDEFMKYLDKKGEEVA